MSTINSVAVVGAGTMGRGIAQSAAANPALRVILIDTSDAALDAARRQLAEEYARLESRGTIDAHESARRMSAIEYTREMGSLASVGLVVEAVPENLDLKLRVLASISHAAGPGSILATNTSSIPITRLAAAVDVPSRFFGVHFFNPAARMPLVEVIRTAFSDGDVEHALSDLIRDGLGKTPIVVSDRPGFIVNALLIPFLLSAARMLEAGYATAEQIDAGMRLGAGHPMGPLALCDLIGLDVVCDAADAMYRETRDPALVVPGVLRRLVEAGALGLKTGAGILEH